MKTVRLTLFIIIIQVVLLLQLTHYYINPIKLSPICSAVQIDTANLTKGQTVDCIVCYTPNRQDFRKQLLLAEINILIPDNKHYKQNADRMLAEQTQVVSQNVLAGAFYIQRQYTAYECQNMFFPEDLGFDQKQHQRSLQKNGIKLQKQVQFYPSDSSFNKELYTHFLQYSQSNIIKSSFISLDIQSIMIRFQYTDISHQNQPVILLHELQHHIFVRIALILVITLEAASLANVLAHQKIVLKILQILLLALAFVSSDFAVAASIVSIYLTLYRIFDQKLVCFLASIAFASLNTYLSTSQFSFIWIVVLNLVYLVYVCCLEQRVKSSCSTLSLFLFLAFNLYFGWILQFKFLVLLTPFHLLAGLLILRIPQKQVKKTQVYDLIRFNDEQEDIMSRIERQLEGK